jgi:hypothetical protein
MFTPLPPASEQSAPAHVEADHDPRPAWRPRGRWPTLLRLSWICRVMALLGAIVCGFAALFGLLAMMAVGSEQQAIGVLFLFGGLLLAVMSYVVWTALAELILLAIAVERNTRQTRDRLARIVSDLPEVIPVPERFADEAGDNS